MGSNNELKEIDIKNHKVQCFNDIKDINNLDLDDI